MKKSSLSINYTLLYFYNVEFLFLFIFSVVYNKAIKKTPIKTHRVIFQQVNLFFLNNSIDTHIHFITVCVAIFVITKITNNKILNVLIRSEYA